MPTDVRRQILDAWVKAISIVSIPYAWLLEEPTAKADVIPKPPVKTRPKPLGPNPTPPPIAQPDIVQNYETTTIVQNTTNNQIFITNNYNFSPVLAPNVQNPVVIPPRRLPKESDGQTAFNTPAGKSISVKEALTERTFGKLLHRPLNRKKLEIPIVPTADVKQEFQDKSQAAMEKIAEWLTTQQTGIPPEDDKQFEFWDTAALISATSLRGFTGDIGFMFGLETLHILARECMRCSLNAFQEVTGLIPIEYEIVDFNPKPTNKYQESEQEFTNISSTLLSKVYRILGGSLWDSEPITSREFYLENGIRIAGFEQYKENDNDEYQQEEKFATEVKPVNIRHLPDLLMYAAATLYYRSGFHRLPAEVPESLIQDADANKNKDLTISDTLHFQEWQTRQLDALIGQFPIEIEIEDSDLVKVGDQKLNISLPNLSETLAELMGLSITMKSFLDANLNASMRTLAEVGSTRKQAISNYYLTASIQDYLGFKSQQKTIDVDFLFNPKVGTDPNVPELISEALKSTSMKVQIEECDDEHSLEARMTALAEAAAIIKAVHWRKVNLNDMDGLKSFFKNIVNFVNETEEKKEDEFDEFIEKVEDGFINEPGMIDTVNPYGRPYDQRPKIRKLGNPT
jgi:hypothetical protein